MAQARPTRAGTTTNTPKESNKTPPVCTVSFCPICIAVTTASDARPEFVEHLMAAGREFLLAVRAIIDARLEGMEPPVKLERLTIE